jgi:hypothetical protein
VRPVKTATLQPDPPRVLNLIRKSCEIFTK